VLGHGRQRLRGAGAQAVALDDLLKSVQPPPHADAAADPLAQEFDADALGLLLAMRAGHPAAAAMRLFRRIGTLPSWEGSAASATHPAPAARVAALAHHAAQGCRLLAGGQALLPTEPRLLPPAEYRQMEAREAPESRPPGKVCAGVPLEPTRRAAMPFAQPFSLGRHVPDGACPHCNPR
jgi:hypothetical protein